MQIPEIEIIVSTAGAEILRKTVRPGEYVIGREADCDVQVEVDLVSRRHAQLTVNFDHALIEDLGSSNGTRINGKPVTEATRLWPNQKIEIGEATLEIRRVKTVGPPDVSLAPATAAMKRLLPQEFLTDRKYDIGGVVAQGGMGAILNAHEASIQRTVAMKVVLDGSSADDLARFVAEARVTGQLEHPNIVPVHELGVDENEQVFYTMKFVRGITLRKVLELMADGNKGTMAKYQLTVLLTIFQKVCDAIAFAHSRGVIHRDLKPENIMLDDFGVVLVMDWGLAKVLGQAEAAAGGGFAQTVRTLPPEAAGATLAGAIMGTPQYMAPEQARGEVETLDVRADIYALGAILYHMLALRPSVGEGEPWEIVAKVAEGNIDPLQSAGSNHRTSPATVKGPASGSARGKEGQGRGSTLRHLPGGRIPDSLAAVVRKAMAFDREQRYATVEALQADLTAYQNGFATGAEQAKLGKQIILLIKRNKGIFTTAFAAWLLITALAVWFVIHLRASEQETRRQAEIAKQNEALAVQQKEEARKALAKSALALAEAARRENNSAEMQTALNDVPEDLRDATWHYLLDQSDSSVARVHINASTIDGVAAHPRLASVFAMAGNNGKIVLMDVRTGNTVLEFTPKFPPKASGGYHIAFSPDGERIVVGRTTTNGLLIHDTHDGKKLAEWDGTTTNRLEFSPDGKSLLQISGDGATLSMLDANTGALRWKYEPEGRSAKGTFTPDSQQVVTYGTQDHVRLVSAQDGSLVRPLSNDSVSTMTVRPDGKALICGRSDGRIKSLSLADGKTVFEIHPQNRNIAYLIFTPDGARFVSGLLLADGRQDLELWDAITGAPQQTLLGGSGSIWDVGLHPLTGELLVAGPNSRVWNLTGAPEKWTLKGGAGDGVVAFWGSDDLIFAPGSGTQCGLQKLQAGTPGVLWKPLDNAYHRVNVSADGRFAAIGKTTGDTPLFVLRNPGPQTEQVATFKPVGGGGTDIPRLSPLGDRLALIQSYSHKLILYDAATGTQPVTLNAKDIRWPRDLGWVGGKQQLVGIATTKADRGNPGSEEWVILWDASSGKILQTVPNRTPMDVLAVAPDGSRFAEAGADKMVRIRDAATLAVLHEFRAHDGPVTALAWHPTKAILATGSTDLSVRLWDIETGRRLEELRGPLAPPNSLAFSPSGRRLACASGESITRIWEPRSINDQPAARQDSGGWEDLMAPLTPAMVAKIGGGWQLQNGALFSPTGGHAALPLSGKVGGTSYQLRVKLRELTQKESFDLILPVGDYVVTFVLDGWPTFGRFTSLNMIDKKEGRILPQAVKGKVLHDSEEHDLEVTVRLDGANAMITAMLDSQPLYGWSGPAASLSLGTGWNCPPGSVALGSMSTDWVVYEVKLKRL